MNALRRAAKAVLPEAVQAWWRPDPAVGSFRRMTSYDRRLLVNEVLSHGEDEGIALSMGYPAWNLLYYSALTTLPRDRPAVVVETGTNHGFSTVVLAQAVRDVGAGGVVHTVDVDPAAVAIARRNVQDAGLSDLVDFTVGDSRAFLRGLREGNDRADFVFLDAGHDLRSVASEFRAAHPLVRRSGTVHFDNTTAGGVRHALTWIRFRYRGQMVEFPHCSWSPPGNAIWQPPFRRRARRR